MPTYGVSHTIVYLAWDSTADTPKTGDSSNHVLRWIKDGTASATTNSPAEVDATNAPGIYKLVLTAAECQCVHGALVGKSDTAGVIIGPVQMSFDQLPSAAPGSDGGLPTVNASNHVAGVIATVSADVIEVSGDATAADNLEAMLDGTGATLSLNNILSVDATKISGDATAADNLEAMLDGTGATLTLNNALAANVTQVSGDSTAADNLEAVLDGTGAAIKFTTLTGNSVTITNATPGEAAVNLLGTGSGGIGLLLQANDATGVALQINDGSDIGIGGGTSDLTGIGSAAATAILSTPANKLLTNASGQVELPTTDGVTAAKLRELLLAALAGTTELTDNGGGSQTLRLFKQDGTTPLVDITFNTTGEWVQTDIDP